MPNRLKLTLAIVLIWTFVAIPTVIFILQPKMSSVLSYKTCFSNTSTRIIIDETVKPKVLIDIPTHVNTSENLIIPCNKPLIWDEKYQVCRAKCEWTGISKLEQRSKQIIIAVFSIVSIAFGLFGIIVRSAVSTSYKVPEVIVMYNLGAMTAFGILLLLPVAIGRKAFFCETPFYKPLYGLDSGACTIQGIFGHFFYLAIHMFWLFYIMNGYFCISNSKQLENKSRVHAAQFMSGVLVPFSCFFASLFHPILYHARSADEVMCTPFNDEMFYYTYMLPQQLCLGISMTYTMLTFEELSKMQRNFQADDDQDGRNNNSNEGTNTTTLPRHFMPFVCLYLTITVIGIVILTIDHSSDVQNRYRLFRYFTCLRTCQPSICKELYKTTADGKTILAKSVYYSLIAALTILFVLPTKAFSEIYAKFKSRVRNTFCPPPNHSITNGIDKRAGNEDIQNIENVTIQASFMI